MVPSETKAEGNLKKKSCISPIFKGDENNKTKNFKPISCFLGMVTKDATNICVSEVAKGAMVTLSGN